LALIPHCCLPLCAYASQRRLTTSSLILLIAALTLWAGVGLKSSLSPDAFLFRRQLSHSLPSACATYGQRARNFLMARNSMQGWWYYFPVPLRSKTPRHVAVAATALVAMWKGRASLCAKKVHAHLSSSVMAPALWWFHHTLAIAYLMPILPGLFVFIARLAIFPLGQFKARIARTACLGASILLLVWAALAPSASGRTIWLIS